MQCKVTMSFIIGCILLALVPGRAVAGDDAARAFAQGQALITEAKFVGAMRALTAAAKSDPDNQEYRQSHAQLRQVIWMREQITKDQSPDRWLALAQPLRAFYHSHKVFAESLPLDRKIHEQRLMPDSAAMLAETLLALGKNSEAAELLAGLGGPDTTTRMSVLLGLALARQGRIDEAKTVTAKAVVAKDSAPRVFYELACLSALVGNTKGAFGALTRSFELTSPGSLEELKAEARGCRDFGALAKTAEFAEALKVESKVEESTCSQGPSCGQCPKRATCENASAHGHQADPKPVTAP